MHLLPVEPGEPAPADVYGSLAFFKTEDPFTPTKTSLEKLDPAPFKIALPELYYLSEIALHRNADQYKGGGLGSFPPLTGIDQRSSLSVFCIGDGGMNIDKWIEDLARLEDRFGNALLFFQVTNIEAKGHKP